MYNRITVLALKILASIIAVGSELFSFYYLFLQFENVLLGSGTNYIVQHDIIFFAGIAVLSTFVHELVEMILDLGDRLEMRGEEVWKKSRMKLQSFS